MIEQYPRPGFASPSSYRELGEDCFYPSITLLSWMVAAESSALEPWVLSLGFGDLSSFGMSKR